MENKEIRFIDSQYNELFRIKDGESITITRSDGEKSEKKCRFLDEYHTSIDGLTFQICQFAEIMERNGNTYRPKDTPSYTLEKVEQEEFEFMFAPEDETKNRGCICYIRGYFDNSIYERFQSTAMIENRENYNKYKTADFSRECDNIINYFRFQSDTPILKSRMAMHNAGYDMNAEQYGGDAEICGYRVTTEKNVYYFKCDSRQRQYNLYCYCYDRQALETFKNLRFVEQNYNKIDRDKFFKTEAGITEVYYNPDADAGGQLVYNEISNDLIKRAADCTKNVSDFFTHIESGCRQYLIDIDTPEFKGNLDSFIKRMADFEGCTEKTMKGLKKHVDIEKNHRKTEPER